MILTKNRELGELLGINKIINGFTSESFSLHKGESKRIKANGILVICSQYYNLYPSIAVISPATKKIEYIGAVSYTHLDVYKRQILVADKLKPSPIANKRK